jgi:2-haloacid dehalogenase
VSPEALAFDLYGTLVDVRSVERACAEVTDEPAALLDLWRATQLQHTWLLSLMGRYVDFAVVTAGALEQAAGRLGLRLDGAERRRLEAAWLDLEPFPEAAAALARLGSRRLAVLSNGSPAMLDAALAAAGLRERLDAVLSADEVRVYKPAPAVYALAERRLGVPREGILFVSANPWDAAGAKAFGLPAAWVARAGGPPERTGPAPDLVVPDLGALADAL